MNKFELFQQQMEKDFEGGSQEVFEICKSLLKHIKKQRFIDILINNYCRDIFWKDYCESQDWLNHRIHFHSFELAEMYFLGKSSEIPRNICNVSNLTPILIQTFRVWQKIDTLDEVEFYKESLTETEYIEAQKTGKVRSPYSNEIVSLSDFVYLEKRIEINKDFLDKKGFFLDESN